MGMYADQIASSEIFRELYVSEGRGGISQNEILQLAGTVLTVADTVGPLLERIPLIFSHYTNHGISHCANILNLIGKFLPSSTKKHLNALEYSVLILSVLFHDLGMYVTDEEKKVAEESDGYRRLVYSHPEYTRALGHISEDNMLPSTRMLHDVITAEYFRRIHASRPGKIAERLFPTGLQFRSIDLAPLALKVAESHGWGVLESIDPRAPEKAVANLDVARPILGYSLNLQYLACCLRLGDILDFDKSRTPPTIFVDLDFVDPISWLEWNKHLQVVGWTINENEISYAVQCTEAVFYVAVMEFLDQIDIELRECLYLIMKRAPAAAAAYRLYLPAAVDRFHIEMADRSYIAGGFRFTLDYERIMELLMDKSLYPDPSLFLRELLQNSLDACRMRQAIASEHQAAHAYTPKIVLWDHSGDSSDPRILFQDNGNGMSLRIVEQFFMRIGQSYYRSPEFYIERQRLLNAGIELEATSQFGIGILSCFMVADRFEVETYRVGDIPLLIRVNGPTRYFTVQKFPIPDLVDFPPPPASDVDDGPLQRPGTRVTVHLRSETNIDALQVLSKFAANIDVPVRLYSPDRVVEVPAFAWESRRPRPSEFPRSINIALFRRDDRDLFREPGEEAFANLDRLLVPVRIPFENYECTQHLHGHAWFWLLRGHDGVGRPRVGYVELTGNTMTLIGLPYFIHILRSIRADLRRMHPLSLGQYLKKLRESLEAHVGMDAAGEDLLDKLPYDIRNFSVSGPREFTAQWNSLSRKERNLAISAVVPEDRRGHFWIEAPTIVEHVLGKNISDEDLDAEFSVPISFRSSPQQFALHGILVPAGLVQWDPMNGTSTTLPVLSVPGGLYLDIRGSEAPTPSANRLFIPQNEAPKISVPFCRAIVRCAMDIAVADGLDVQWIEWIRFVLNAVGESSSGRDAIALEAVRLNNLPLLAMKSNQGGTTYRTASEIWSEFGGSFPRARSSGLQMDDPVTKILIAHFVPAPRFIRSTKADL